MVKLCWLVLSWCFKTISGELVRVDFDLLSWLELSWLVWSNSAEIIQPQAQLHGVGYVLVSFIMVYKGSGLFDFVDFGA